MVIGRFKLGAESVTLGRKKDSDDYYVSTANEIDGNRELRLCLIDERLDVARSKFESITREIISMKLNSELLNYMGFGNA